MSALIWLVISALVAVCAVVYLVATRKSRAESRNRNGVAAIGTWVGGIFLALSAVVAAAIFIFGSFYTQGEGEANVIVSVSGEVTGVTTDAGFHSKAPWDGVKTYDIRNQKIEMFTNDSGTGADGAVIGAPLEGGANAYVSITVLYSVAPNDVVSLYKNFGSQEALLSNKLRPSLRDIVREVTSEYAPLAVKTDRAAISNEIFEAISANWADYGVTVEEVNLGDIKLDDRTEDALTEVNAAQQGVEKSRAELEQAQIDAERTKTEAKAAADADQIVRCGATITTETQLINGKETEVQVVAPKSNAECENRLNEQVLTTRWYDVLAQLGASGNMVVILPEDGTAPIINIPTPAQTPAAQ